jgi:uncharacterized membrane protein YdbT with pleckstrin-like domain
VTSSLVFVGFVVAVVVVIIIFVCFVSWILDLELMCLNWQPTNTNEQRQRKKKKKPQERPPFPSQKTRKWAA